jgi:hypothetical protein
MSTRFVTKPVAQDSMYLPAALLLKAEHRSSVPRRSPDGAPTIADIGSTPRNGCIYLAFVRFPTG